MFTLLLLLSFTQLCFSASSGAAVCNVLGMCRIPSLQSEGGKCPLGMDKVSAPVRSGDFSFRSGDLQDISLDVTTYVPEQVMDLHLTVNRRNYKYLGILIYAVQAGVHPVEGCPEGCDGNEETQVGSWDVTETSLFHLACGTNTALTHHDASLKRLHHVFRWRAPEAGLGPVIFRVLLKYGATNGGSFFWPNAERDLMLEEAETQAPPLVLWTQGQPGQSCSQACRATAEHKYCDPSQHGTIDSLWNEARKYTSCRMPLLSSCSGGAFSVDSEGFCYFGHDDNEGCPNEAYDPCSSTNIEGERVLCPCTQMSLSASNEDSNSNAHSFSILGLLFLLCVSI